MRGRLDPHAKYRELLAARLDRPLTRAENRVLVGHLKGCGSCRQVERDYRDQSSWLRSLPTPHPPRDMWARTSTALDHEMSRGRFGPRVGRRRVVRAAKSGAPSALATVVAAVGVVTALAALQLVPTRQPAAGTDAPHVSTVAVRPTPFAIKPEPLALVRTEESDLTFYDTIVDRVCPLTAPDCVSDSKFVERRVSIPAMSKLHNLTLSGDGRMAFVGQGHDRDVIAVVLLEDEAPPTSAPTRTPTETPTERPTARATPTLTADPRTDPPTTASTDPSDDPDPTSTAGSSPGRDPSATPTADVSPTQTPGRPSATPVPATPEETPTPTPEVEETPTPTDVVTMPTVEPTASREAGATVVSILEDVHSAGSPPAWSRDGEVLAFSAMPADGSHGPDVYIWEPGDATARAITTDHSSYFASWSGRRIVVSRLSGETGSSAVETSVIDPQTLEERTVAGPQMWLPVVDPQRTRAVAWHGALEVTTAGPDIGEGALYVVDWAALNPFGADDGDAPPSNSAEVELTPLQPWRDVGRQPVVDWNARWSTDGLILGVWVADAPTSSWGNLELFGVDAASGQLNTAEPLLAQFAKRGFAIGSDRVAWIAPSAAGVDGELRIRTWGIDGVGDLRIQQLEDEELVPIY